jgi:ribulose-phosphate 3-epimerase
MGKRLLNGLRIAKLKYKPRKVLHLKKLLAPSMMCANFGALENEVAALDNANVDCFHIDIMDGNFVPNFGMGLQDLELIRKSTKKLVDAHLMIQDPSKYVNLFADKGIDILYIHPEADMHPTRTLAHIRERNMKPGIAINPGTSVATIEQLLSLVDYVMVMTVNPGFAGQKYLPYVNEKIETLVKIKNTGNHDYKVMVDGAISPEKVEELSKLGVEGFILGTSSLFGKEDSYETIINQLRKL